MGRFSQAFERIHNSMKALTSDEQALADAKTELNAAEADIEAAVVAKVGDMIQEQVTAAVRQVQSTPPAGLATAADVQTLTERVAALENAKPALPGSEESQRVPVLEPLPVVEPEVLDPAPLDPEVVHAEPAIETPAHPNTEAL